MNENGVKSVVFFWAMINFSVAYIVTKLCLPDRSITFKEFLKAVKLFFGAFFFWPYYGIKFLNDTYGKGKDKL